MKKSLLLLCLVMTTVTTTAVAAPLTNFSDQRNAIDFGFWHTKMDQSILGGNPGPNPGPDPDPNPNPGPNPGPDPDPDPNPGPNPGPDPDPDPNPGPNPGPDPCPIPPRPVCPPGYSYLPQLSVTPAIAAHQVLGMTDEGHGTRNNLYGAITLGLNDKTGLQFRYFDIKSSDGNSSKQYGKNMEYNVIYSLQKNIAMFAGVNQYKLAGSTTNAMSVGLIAKAPLGKSVEAYTIAGVGQHSLRHLEVGVSAAIAKDLDLNIGYRVFEGKDRNDTAKAKYNGVLVGVTHRFGHTAKKTTIEEVVPQPEKPAEKIILNNVNFDFDKASLRPEAYPALDNVVDIAKENPDWQFLLIGHTDGIGTDEYNMGLSERRVNTVKDYIVTNGVEQQRIEVDWKGKREPVDTNDTAEGRANNRRVELEIK